MTEATATTRTGTGKPRGRKPNGRGNGDGMAPRKRADGRWETRATLLNGMQKSIYGRTRKEAEDKKRELQRQQDAGLDLTAKRETVGRFLDRWLADVAAQKVRPSTLKTYRCYVEGRIVPALGKTDLAKLTPAQVQTFLNAQTAAGLKPRTVQQIRAILRAALGQALKWGLVTRNAAALADPPKQVKAKVTPLTAEEARVLIDKTKTHADGPLYALAMLTGLRQGELLGLRWQDVDLDAGALTVRQALQRVDGEWRFVEPKSETSRRTIPLPAAAVAHFKTQRTRQLEARLALGERWQGEAWGLVFLSEVGTPLDGTNVTKRLQRALAAANLPRQRFHDLRHACASLLLAQGVPLATIRDILGHSQISLTANTYAHVAPELRREAAAAMDALFPTGTGD